MVKKFVPESDQEFQRLQNKTASRAKSRTWSGVEIERQQFFENYIVELKEELAEVASKKDIPSDQQISKKLLRKQLQRNEERRREIPAKIAELQHEMKSQLPEDTIRIIKELFNELAGLQKRAENARATSEWTKTRIDFLKSEIQYMLDSPLLVPDLKGLSSNARYLRTSAGTKRLLGVLSSKESKHEARYDMLVRHEGKMAEREKILFEFSENVRREFIEVLEWGAQEGFLPQEVLQAIPRIEALKITLMDRLSEPSSRVLAHNRRGEATALYSDQLEDQPLARHCLFHEFFHEVSGFGAHLVERNRISGPEVRGTKEGLSLPAKEWWWRDPYFTWLNEAITEWLTLKFSGYESESKSRSLESYKDERRKLEMLIENGLEESVILNAYFENITSNQAPKDRARHFATLVRRINKVSDDPRAFNRIENQFVLEQKIAPSLESLPLYEANVFSDIEDWRIHVPEGNRIYLVSTMFGARADSAFSKEYYAIMPLDQFESLGGNDEKAIQFLNDQIRARVKGLERRFTWSVTFKALGVMPTP